MSRLVSAALALSVLAFAAPSFAQAPSPGMDTTATPAARTKREPTVGQMAASERRKKCGVEWKEAKAAGTTGGLKWPRFYSQCNARLKGNQA